MELEHFLSGYCRCIDQSRIVTAITENGKLTEVDCSFGQCPYEGNCPIAAQLSDLK